MVLLAPQLLAAGEPLKQGRMLGVVELFTSQGCSSCPPADVVLKSYLKRRDVVALSYSVDYWDYLGWRDTLGQPAHSKRQRDYARTRGDRAVYTPQAVVNGVSHVNGAHKALIDREIERTGNLLVGKKVKLLVREHQKKYSIEFDRDIGKLRTPLILWMVRVKKIAAVKIKRGENGGRELRYHNVVMGAEKCATLKTLVEPIRNFKPKHSLRKDEHLVFLLQEGETGPIIGAVEMS